VAVWFLPTLVALASCRVWIIAVLLTLNVAALVIVGYHVGIGLNLELALYPLAMALATFGRWTALRAEGRALLRAQIAEAGRRQISFH
jgi:hypothetical protein